MATLPPLGNPNPKLADALKQLSAAKYGRPRAVVEKDIFARMATKEPLASSFPPPSSPGGFQPPNSNWSPPASGQRPAMGSQSVSDKPKASPAGTSGASFLDEWLSKKNQPAAKSPHTAVPATPRETAQDNQKPSVGSRHTESPTSTILVPPSSDDHAMGKNSTAHNLRPIEHQDRDEGTKNISSDVIEKKEVDKIAHELKSHLNPSERTKDSEFSIKKLNAAKSNRPLTQRPAEGADDTIYIDPEGTLHIKNTEDE